MSGSARAEEQSAAQESPSTQPEAAITVYGQRLDIFRDIKPESELDEAGIAAYGANNVGELLTQIKGEVDTSSDGPVILINGRETTGVDEVSTLPPEAVRLIQILPNRVAGQLGERPTRRVINVVLKDNHRQVTVNGEYGFATAGGGDTYRAELNLLRLRNGNRESLVFNASRVNPLFESDRDIIADAEPIPFDVTGNIVSYPLVGAEIDPALSALAGQLTRVAAVPGSVTSPTLADFAVTANRPGFTDVRPYRTLVSASEIYSAAGNVTRHLGKTTIAVDARVERNDSDSQSGLASVLLRVPVGTPFSPFNHDVDVARFVGDPLRRDTGTTTVQGSADVSTPIGSWNLQVTANAQHVDSQTDTQLAFDPAALQAAVSAGTVNPFVALPAALTAPGDALATSTSDSLDLRATVTGVVTQLPAGALTGALTADVRTDRTSGQSRYLAAPTITKYRQDEALIRASLRIPILGDKSAVGDLALDLNGAVRSLRHLGTVTEEDAGLVWRPTQQFDVHGSVDVQRLAPSAQTLSDPIVVSENYRVFDFVSGQTVLVRYLSGGNPDLPIGSRRILTLGMTYRPWSKTNLLLSGEYTSQRSTDLQATLPPVTAQVQAAFPDRFIRDANGTLVMVDSRPVPFALQNTDQLHWRIDYHGAIARRPAESGQVGNNAPTDPAFSSNGSVRLNLSVEHSWTLASVRQARAGLPVVDLLAGGANGYGGGVPRHIVRVFANVAARGLGAQVDGSWRSSTEILADSAPSADDLFFSAQVLVNARLFADLGSLFVGRPWFKGARLSVAVNNVFDDKQRVRDRTGVTPIRYQPYLQDPLGRTVTIGLRKVF